MRAKTHLLDWDDNTEDGIPTGRGYYFAVCGLDNDRDKGTEDPAKVRCPQCRKWMKENDVRSIPRSES